MKKMVFVWPVILLFMYSVLPAVSLINLLSGYTFSLRNYYVYAVITALVSLTALVMALCIKEENISCLNSFCVLILPLVSLLNWLCYIMPAGWKTAALSMPFCFVCALFYMVKYIKHKKRKIVILVVYTVLFIPLFFFSFLDCIFGSFGSVTVVQEVYSPDGKYKAEVINNDQGALGGTTLVNVCNTGSVIDLYFFRISRKPHLVYSGAWNEYKDIEIRWTDNSRLLVNGSEYTTD